MLYFSIIKSLLNIENRICKLYNNNQHNSQALYLISSNAFLTLMSLGIFMEKRVSFSAGYILQEWSYNINRYNSNYSTSIRNTKVH